MVDYITRGKGWVDDALFHTDGWTKDTGVVAESDGDVVTLSGTVKTTGTADSGTTTTTVDAERTEANDYWNGAYIKFTSGPNNGLIRLITDFDSTIDTITHEAFPNPVAVGHTYEILVYYKSPTISVSLATYPKILIRAKGAAAGNLDCGLKVGANWYTKTLALTTEMQLFELAPSDFGLTNETIVQARFGNQSVAGNNYIDFIGVFKEKWAFEIESPFSLGGGGWSISVHGVPLSEKRPIVLPTALEALTWPIRVDLTSQTESNKFDEMVKDGWNWFWTKNCKVVATSPFNNRIHPEYFEAGCTLTEMRTPQ